MTSLRRVDTRVTWLTILLVLGVSAVILMVLSPGWILNSTTPSGGDMGAHVFGPAYLRDTLLPEGRIMGWSNDWFAGFPAFYFYFPLPSLTIVALDLMLPYGVAFKIVTVLGLLGLAPATYFLARSLKVGRGVSLVASGSAAVFALFESFTIYGGNVASTLAGEFSYSWSFSLSLVYLGLLIRAIRDDRKYLKWAAITLALTALSHVLTTLVIVFASLFVLRWKKGLSRWLAISAWGFAIAAFWALPLLLRIGYTSDMAWSPLSRWDEVFPVEIWILLPLAIGGIAWSLIRSTRSLPVVAATLLPVIYYPLPLVLPQWFPDMFGESRWKLWNGRLLPYWYWGITFFSAIAIGAGVMWLARRLPSRVSSMWPRLLLVVATVTASAIVADSADFPWWGWIPVALAGALFLGATVLWRPDMNTRRFLTTATLSVLVLGALAGVTFIDGWARWNYTGYEAKEPWPEYEALMMEIDELPNGRVQWEGNGELNQYGTPMAPMLIPYWTEGSHQSMEGLYFESSLTTPFHFINSSEMSANASNPIPGLKYHNLQMDRGIRHLRLFGVTHYVAFTEEATEAANQQTALAFEASTGPFTIYRLPESPLVEAARFVPSVYDDSQPEATPFHDFALEWYDDVENLDRWVATDGPADWPRIETLDERGREPLAIDAKVTDIVIDNHRISFTTDAVGIPHLVKVSYFPNWTASGALGPWRAAPSLMVVVPTTPDVVIEFADTAAETGGKLLTVAGLGGLMILGIVQRRRRSALRQQPSNPE